MTTGGDGGGGKRKQKECERRPHCHLAMQSVLLFEIEAAHHTKSESLFLTENCFREIFKNELRQDVFSFSFIFILFASILSSGFYFAFAVAIFTSHSAASAHSFRYVRAGAHLFFVCSGCIFIVLRGIALCFAIVFLAFFDFILLLCWPCSLRAQLRFAESLSDCHPQ